MKIPKRFKLAGITIEVEETDSDLGKNVLGISKYHEQKIVLKKDTLPEQTREQTFFHELVHWMFYVLSEDVLQKNEKLVDTLAYLFHQFMETAEYE